MFNPMGVGKKGKLTKKTQQTNENLKEGFTVAKAHRADAAIFGE